MNLRLFLEIFQTVLYIAILITLIKLMIFKKPTIADILKKLNYLHNLISVVGAGMDSPIHKALFYEIVRRGKDNPMTPKEEQKFFQDIVFNAHKAHKQKMLEDVEQTNDPIIKERYEKKIAESDHIMTLLNTIDENTSKEQIQIIMNNVVNSANNMYDIDQGIL